MFDIGGWEFLVIAVVAIVVIGPKDLPAAVKAVSSWVGKARELAREFRSGLDELQREVELDKIEKEVRSSIGADEIEQAANSIRNEVEGAGREIESSADPSRPAKDGWDDAYTYFQDQPDMAHDAVEQEARRKLAEAEAEEATALEEEGATAPGLERIETDRPAGEKAETPPAAGGRSGA